MILYYCQKTVYGEFFLYVCTGTHMHMCVHICRSHRITSGVVPQERPSFVWDRVSHWPRALSSRRDCLNNRLHRQACVVRLSPLELQPETLPRGFTVGSEFWSSCLQGMHFCHVHHHLPISRLPEWWKRAKIALGCSHTHRCLGYDALQLLRLVWAKEVSDVILIDYESITYV